MEACVRFTVFLYCHEYLKYLSFDEMDLKYLSFDEMDVKDGTDLEIPGFRPVCPDGVVEYEAFPLCAEMCRVGGALFIVGGTLLEDDPMIPILGQTIRPSKWLWSTQPPSLPGRGDSTHTSGLSPMTWTRCTTAMNSNRSGPMAIPLHDGRIFICGGTDVLECWVEIYDPKKGEFDRRDLPDYILNGYPASCFLWDDEASSKHHHHEALVMLYYHSEPRQRCEYFINPSLLSYDVERNIWRIFADNLPVPEPPGLFQLGKRNLVYVGDNILFIIDHASRWFVYDLSARKEVGTVDVMVEDGLVLEALYLHSFRNSDSGSTSLIFYIFMPNKDDCYGTSDIRYAKVEVVQRKGEDYNAQVHSSGVLKVGDFSYLYAFADKASCKRAADEDCYRLASNKNRRGRGGARLVSPETEDSPTLPSP